MSSFENNAHQKNHKAVEIKRDNVKTNEIKFFDPTVKNDNRTYNNIQKNNNSHEEDYTNGCPLDYTCFNKHYKIIAIDLSG